MLFIIPYFYTVLKKILHTIIRALQKHKIKSLCFFVLLILYWIWLPSKLFNKPYATILTDANNDLLAAKIASDGQWRFPETKYVPHKIEQCLIYFEDEYFYYHPGVNPASLINSFARNIKSGKIKSGGSTLTMQVARMMRGNKERNYFQKFVEVLLAIRIELSYKKSSILKLYCSHAPFGSNIVGIEAASWRYFGRKPSQLSWAESALLAVLPNAPSLIYPGKNQAVLLQKRNRLLKKLHQKKVIDAATYKLALAEGIPQKAFPLPQLAFHLMEHCINQNGAEANYQTSLQKNLQIQAQDILNKHVESLLPNQIHNACALIAETQSGKILAYIGNSQSNTNEFQNFVDLIQAPRSTGSILKPFLYAFMLNEEKILPASLIEDVPIQIGSYGPKNFHLNYDGLVPANQAIARSLNVPAVKMLMEYGSERFLYRLKQLGFSTFTKPPKHYGLSLILGGGEATLFEIASAYASLGRSLHNYNNKYNYTAKAYHPLFYLNNASNKLDSYKGEKEGLLSASAIWFTFNAMTELIRPQDFVGWAQFLNRHKIAWKTGTSFGFRDAWAVGLDDKYTVAVWVGNATGEGRPELTGSAVAAPLMFKLFNLLPQKKWFQKPSNDIKEIAVCRESGFKASAICPNKKQQIPKNSNKTPVCTFHKSIHLTEDDKYRVNSNCYPVSKMKEVSWFVLTPVQEYFYKQHHPFYKELPPWKAECVGEGLSAQLDIVYPRDNFKLYIPVDESGQKSLCVFKATHKKEDATVFWHLDGTYIGSTYKFHQVALNPKPGKHHLLITDTEGEKKECRFEVLEK